MLLKLRLSRAITEKQQRRGTGAPDKGRWHLPLVGRDVALLVYPEKTGPRVTGAMVQAARPLLALGPEAWSSVAALLESECRVMMDMSDLGLERLPDDTDFMAANRRFAGLNPDGSAPEGWADPAWLRDIRLRESYDGTRAFLGFRPPWEEEHGVFIESVDGHLRAATW